MHIKYVGAFLQDWLWGQILEPFGSHTLDLSNLVEPDMGSMWAGNRTAALPRLQTSAVLSSTFRMPGNSAGIGTALPQHQLTGKWVSHQVDLWPLDKGGGFVFIPAHHTKQAASTRAHSLKTRPTKTKGKLVSSFSSFIASVMAAWVAKKKLKSFQDS